MLIYSLISRINGKQGTISSIGAEPSSLQLLQELPTISISSFE